MPALQSSNARELDIPLRAHDCQDSVSTDDVDSRSGGPGAPFEGSWFSRIFLTWVFPVLQSSASVEQLQPSDLFTVCEEARAEVLYSAFIAKWRDAVNRRNPTGRQPRAGSVLLRVLAQLHYKELRLPWLGRVLQTLLAFAFPLFLNLLIKFVSDGNEPVWKGLLYASLLFLAQAVEVVIDNNVSIAMQSLGLRIRASMIAAILRKVLVLRQDSLLSFSSGRLNNMITTDVDKARKMVRYIHILLFTAPFQILVSLFALHQLVGSAVFIGLSWMGVVILLNPIIMYYAGKLQEKQQSNTDERVRKATEVVSSIQVVKCYAWEEATTEKVELARKAELLSMWRLYAMYCVMEGLWSSVVPVTTAVMFASYSVLNPDKPLAAAQAFTAMNLLAILQEPLFTMPWVLNCIIEALVAAKRLEKLFQLPEAMLPCTAAIGSFCKCEVTEAAADESNTSNRETTEMQLMEGRAVDFSGASFTWPIVAASEGVGQEADNTESPAADAPGTEFKLRDINLKIPNGALVAIVGATGSGKTSLLQAVLGEMPEMQGADEDTNCPGSALVRRHRPIAFAPQQPWIFNATVRQNILFGEAFVEKRYMECLRCCGLEQDLALLKSGDLTKVGEKGIALSGGQKARICLARAIYRHHISNLFVLDDPYSALDAHVAQGVHEEAVRGVLAKRTRLLVTNRLEFVNACDLVVVLDGGRIEAIGSYGEVSRSSTVLRGLLAAQGLEVVQDDGDSELPAASLQLTRAISYASAGSGGEEAGSGEAPAGEEDEEEEEERASGQIKKEVIFYYLQKMGGPGTVTMLAMLYIISEALSLSLPIWMAIWTAAGPTGDGLYHFLNVYVALSFGVIVMMTTRDIIGTILGFRAARRMHAAMFASVLRAPMSFFQDTPHGRITNRFSKDTSEIDKDLIWACIYTLVPVLSVIGNFAMVGGIAYMSIIAFMPAFWLYYLLWKYYNKAALDLKRISKVLSSPVYDHFSNLCRENAITVVRAHHQVEQQCIASDRYIVEQQRPEYTQTYMEFWFCMRVEHLGCVLVFLVSVFAVFARSLGVSASAAALALSFAGMCSNSVQSMIGQFAEFGMAFNCVERVMHYSTALPAEAALVTERRPPCGWPSRGVLRVENLKLRYRAGLPLVLKGVSFCTAAGERLGVVGRTGAGKSSLLLALLRIIEPEPGSVLNLDGEDLALLGLKDLRSAVAMIPQEPVLFQESLQYNCDPFQQHSMPDIWAALEEAQLAPWIRERTAVDESSNDLQKLLALEIKERGQNLSAGQRQMVSIARAVLRRSKLVVLDEATAAVDAATDSAIQTAVRRCFRGATTLTIAHRLNTILDCDRILVLSEGEVAELGPPSELRLKENGIFSSLLEASERQ